MLNEWRVTGEMFNLQTEQIEYYDAWVDAWSKEEAMRNSIYKMEQMGYEVKKADAVPC